MGELFIEPYTSPPREMKPPSSPVQSSTSIVIQSSDGSRHKITKYGTSQQAGPGYATACCHTLSTNNENLAHTGVYSERHSEPSPPGGSGVRAAKA